MTFRRFAVAGAFGGLIVASALVSGCQTQVPATLQTLPSGRYLQHPPQYIPPSPAFPLIREAATLEKTWADAGVNLSGTEIPVRPVPVGPAPVAPGGGGAPVPLPPPGM
jgi:hypothetical protein